MTKKPGYQNKKYKKSIIDRVFYKVRELLNQPTTLWAGVSKLTIQEYEDYIEIKYLTQQSSMSQWKTIKIWKKKNES